MDFGLDVGFKYKTHYDYVTSEDESVSMLGTVSWGTIVLNDRRTSAKLNVKYRCVSIGNGKGLPVNVSHASFDNWSGGGSVMADRYFDANAFPCRGYMIGAGAGVGLTEVSENSGNLTIALFGMMPVFAGLRMWGANIAALPGVGMSAGLAHFWVE